MYYNYVQRLLIDECFWSENTLKKYANTKWALVKFNMLIIRLRNFQTKWNQLNAKKVRKEDLIQNLSIFRLVMTNKNLTNYLPMNCETVVIISSFVMQRCSLVLVMKKLILPQTFSK